MSGVDRMVSVIEGLQASVLAQVPVRLVTADEPAGGAIIQRNEGWNPSAIAGWTAGAIGLAIAAVVTLIFVRRRLLPRHAGGLDQQAAMALAKRLGLSRRARATLWDLARMEVNGSALDLLVSVKKLNAATTRRAASTSGDAARESLRELCLVLGAEVPSFPDAVPMKHEARKQGPGTRTGPRVSVVSPRMMSRKG